MTDNVLELLKYNCSDGLLIKLARVLLKEESSRFENLIIEDSKEIRYTVNTEFKPVKEIDLSSKKWFDVGIASLLIGDGDYILVVGPDAYSVLRDDDKFSIQKLDKDVVQRVDGRCVKGLKISVHESGAGYYLGTYTSIDGYPIPQCRLTGYCGDENLAKLMTEIYREENINCRGCKNGCITERIRRDLWRD